MQGFVWFSGGKLLQCTSEAKSRLSVAGERMPEQEEKAEGADYLLKKSGQEVRERRQLLKLKTIMRKVYLVQ